MGAAHCLELGLMKHHWEQYEDAYGWLTEAWKRLSQLDRDSGITTKEVLQYLIWAEYKVRGLKPKSYEQNTAYNECKYGCRFIILLYVC